MNANEITYKSTDLECYEFFRLAIAENVKDAEIPFDALVAMIYQMPEEIFMPALMKVAEAHFNDPEKSDLAKFMIAGVVRHIKSIQLESLN